jgi:hypothetical protein
VELGGVVALHAPFFTEGAHAALSSAVRQEIRVRSGRDDTSVWVFRVCYGKFGRAEGRTADPSTSLGMTKGRGVPPVEIGLWIRGTAGPSAPVGMTKGRAAPSVEIGLWI